MNVKPSGYNIQLLIYYLCCHYVISILVVYMTKTAVLKLEAQTCIKKRQLMKKIV
jgi:hypothetical protein